MAKPKKTTRKPAVKMNDLEAKSDPKGGVRDASSGMAVGRRIHKPSR